MAWLVKLLCVLFTVVCVTHADSEEGVEAAGSTQDQCSQPVSAVQHVSAGTIEIRQETSFTVKPSEGVQSTCSTDCNATDIHTMLTALQESVNEIKDTLARLEQAQCAGDQTQNEGYPVISKDGARWRRFWWYEANTEWPSSVTDVLQDEYGDCDSSAPYCFSRLPQALQEAGAEMLGVDSAGTVYRWSFDSTNDVAHAVWQAFHDHQEVRVNNGNVWNPVTVSGTEPGQPQDSFHYRLEHGVKSLQIDDDNCDCYTSLSLGHGMCGDAFSTTYGPENVFGVDLLYDTYCQTPSPANGLSLYFRDEDDCAGVECPMGSHCVDGIGSYTCPNN